MGPARSAMHAVYVSLLFCSLNKEAILISRLDYAKLAKKKVKQDDEVKKEDRDDTSMK
jgi:hypothetical protein